MSFVIEVIGWVGAFLTLYAYALVSKAKVSGDSSFYQMLNVGGASFLVLHTVYNGAIPSAIVNLVWIGIAFSALSTRRPSRLAHDP